MGFESHLSGNMRRLSETWPTSMTARSCIASTTHLGKELILIRFFNAEVPCRAPARDGS